jgi:membrane protease YdiL (CAAX protease family)
MVSAGSVTASVRMAYSAIVRAFRDVALLGLLAALLFGGEWLALRGANLLWTLVPRSQTWKVGALWFYSLVLLELALVSVLDPQRTRTSWWPQTWDAWATVGLCAAVFVGPLGAALFRWAPLHWHPPVSGLSFLSGAFLDPLAEEWAFRGILWRACEWVTGPGRGSPVVAGGFTSLVFGLWHIPFQEQSSPYPLLAIVLANAAFGICLSVARCRLKAIGPGTIVHALGNSFYLLTN